MLDFMVTTPLLSSDAACDCHSKQTNTEQSTLRLENDKEIDRKIGYVLLIQGLLLGPALMWTLARTYMLNVAGFTKYLIVITMFTFIQLVCVDVEALDKIQELALYLGQSGDFFEAANCHLH